MEQRLTEYHKKWVTYEYVASCHLLRLVLNETRVLANLLQTDELMVYEIYDGIVSTKDNLMELTLRSDEEELPFQNVEFDRVRDECKIKVSAVTRKGAATDKERALTEREHHEAEGNINVIHETFTLKNVCTGKAKVKDLRKKLLGEIVKCVSERFDRKEAEVELLKAKKVFDWAAEDDEDIWSHDRKSLLAIHSKFSDILKDVDVKEMCKEWPKVKNIVQRNYGHLAKTQHTVWSKFLTKQGSHYPNCKLVIEIILVILASSSAVERGFSTTKLQLTDRRSHMKNALLNEILRIKINIPMLRKVYVDIETMVVVEAVALYHWKKKLGFKLKDTKKMRDTDAIGVSRSNVMDTNAESDNDDEGEGLSDCYISENNSSDVDSSKGETYSDVENFGDARNYSDPKNYSNVENFSDAKSCSDLENDSNDVDTNSDTE